MTALPAALASELSEHVDPGRESICEIVDAPEIDRKIAEAAADVPRATQSSMDGHVAQKLTCEDWLNMKSEAFQKEVVGVGKWELWQKGQIGLKHLSTRAGAD